MQSDSLATPTLRSGFLPNESAGSMQSSAGAPPDAARRVAANGADQFPSFRRARSHSLHSERPRELTERRGSPPLTYPAMPEYPELPAPGTVCKGENLPTQQQQHTRTAQYSSVWQR